MMMMIKVVVHRWMRLDVVVLVGDGIEWSLLPMMLVLSSSSHAVVDLRLVGQVESRGDQLFQVERIILVETDWAEVGPNVEKGGGRNGHGNGQLEKSGCVPVECAEVGR